MSEDTTIQQVTEILKEQLEERGFRKTPERFAILKEIYSNNRHFDAEDLFFHMKQMEYRVSRATVYNTLELLVDCDLVKKQQFGNNLTYYEKSFNYKQHDHLICNSCGKVMEFCDPRVQQIKSIVSNIMDFEVSHHSLNIYGKCASCKAKV